MRAGWSGLLVVAVVGCSDDGSSIDRGLEFGNPIFQAEAIACLGDDHVAVLSWPDKLEIVKIVPDEPFTRVVRTLPAVASAVQPDWMGVSGDRLYVSDSTNGGGLIHVYDISDVTSPVEIGTTTMLPYGGVPVGNVWYVPDAMGIRAIDLTTISAPVLGPVTRVYRRLETEIPTPGKVVAVLDGSVLVVESRNDQLTMFDLTDPLAPAELQRIAFDGTVISGAVEHDGLLYVGATYPGVLDVRDPRSATIVTIAYPSSRNGMTPLVGHPVFGVFGIENLVGTSIRTIGHIGHYDLSSRHVPQQQGVALVGSTGQRAPSDSSFYPELCFEGNALVARDNISARFVMIE
jgi:hypothetical protein